MMYPYVNEWEKQQEKKEKHQERRMRIFMRGVKIGSKKGGTQITTMSMFEMQTKKKISDPEEA